MASINNSNIISNNTTTGGTNMYRVGDYVYFETQQQQSQSQSLNHQQPFQIRRIEELNKTAGGNVEAKVMCFYRRRDLPAQLVALADKHQQQQISLTLSLSPGESGAIKGSGKQTPVIKASIATDKNIIIDKKDQDMVDGALGIVKKEHLQDLDKEQTCNKVAQSEVTEILKEKQQNVETTESTETDSAASAIIKTGDVQKINHNDKIQDSQKDNEKIQAAQQNVWWRGEQLKQRELFLSRQVETLAATHIRGKCTVTLYNETESLDSYLEKEDTFFYCLVFDPVQKTLLADKGEIRVGHKYQAEVPPKALFSHSDSMTKDLTTIMIKDKIYKEESSIINSGDEPMVTECISDDPEKSSTVATVTAIGTLTTIDSDSELETLIWTCKPQWNRLTDRQIDQFLVVSRSLGTFARALDCTSSVKQPSLHMSAAAASRDITLFHAMDTLHRHGYDLGTATCSLVPSTGPVLCRDEMEEWSASEANLFEEALEKYGKDFGDIRHDFLPWKTHKNIVEYYYMWKTTDRYVQQKRVKAVEQESKLKQVYIPSYIGISSSLKQHAITSTMPIKSSQQLVNGSSTAIELYSPKNNSGTVGDGPLLPGVCDLCDVAVSHHWYPNTIGTTSLSYNQQNGGLSVASSTLCHECWTHWKKYCGPRIATSENKVITAGRGDSISGDEDRPHSNASSSSAAMNLNISGSGRSSSNTTTLSAPHHHHHLMNLGGSGHHNNYHHQQQSLATPTNSDLLLHQPHINSSGSSITVHRCTIIGCQVTPFKSKSQLLRHYSTAHGIGGINSNSSSSPTNNITSASSRSFGNGVDINNIGKLSPIQQQATSGTSYSLHNSGGPLNLNSNSNTIQHSNTTSGNVNQVINLVASSSLPQQQPNNLSITGGIINNSNTVTATGRPVMKTRTAFYLRCTSLVKASRRRAAQQAANKISSSCSSATMLSPSSTIQPGCLARPRNVARRPFICVPQTAHTYKHECMLSMQHAPIHELKTYLRAAAVKAHARRPGVTRVANALIAARRGRSGITSTTAADLAVPDWLTLPSQQHQHQSSHHHVSSSSKHGKHSSRLSTGGRVAFPRPPKAPDGSLLYERVPNKQEAAAALNNPSVTPAAVGLNSAILGVLGSTGSAGSGGMGASGLSNDQTATGFDVTTAIYQQQQQSSSSSGSNKRRLYETDGGAPQEQPQPQAGPPSKRMHRQQYSQQQHSITGHYHNQQQQHHQTSASTQGASGGAVDGMLASLVAHQQQQQQRGGSVASGGGPLQLTASGKSSGHQHAQHNHYRTPSMARTGRKHVISWTDAPDDLYYRCTALSKSLRKARMTGRELRRSARKPWQPIVALLGISFTMPPAATSTLPQATTPGTGSTAVTGPPIQQPGTTGSPSSASGTPFDMSTNGGRQLPVMSSNQSSVTSIPVPQSVNCAPAISSRSSSGGSSHH